ncbi:hypothetical protein PG997_001915 [Apiospora hydei]|uniref:Uncharacterized protein n=1 Tax=Apiospora hydei TaxID=1337664 RepID=A0ABR1X7V3_9PEZI
MNVCQKLYCADSTSVVMRTEANLEALRRDCSYWDYDIHGVAVWGRAYDDQEFYVDVQWALGC